MSCVFNDGIGDITLTACPYRSDSGIEHQLYLTVENQGIFGYDTGSGVFTKVSSSTAEIMLPVRLHRNNEQPSLPSATR